MQLWSNLVIICLLILACTGNIARSTSNSPNPQHNDQKTTNSKVSIDTTSITTKEDITQKSALNATIDGTSSNVNQTINSNSTSLKSTDLETTTENVETTTEIVEATNSSNFVYTVIPTEEKESNNSQIDTEVEDLLKVPEHTDDDSVHITNDPDPIIFLSDDSINGWKLAQKYHEEPVLERKGLVPGKVAAILAGVFVALSVVGYVALLSWRRYLENRYGNREMLVEDDYCEKQMNDLEHFSI
ncbi:unnamed protein product [Diabrotica balteata]|uniref:Uncharacterized protein n=1 Tax=Diabrotica balteata TaxID=107213 RepID=A0A9P0GVB4_DIABA|nr:unnamed protein product [Diabrotica balteata]